MPVSSITIFYANSPIPPVQQENWRSSALSILALQQAKGLVPTFVLNGTPQARIWCNVFPRRESHRVCATFSSMLPQYPFLQCCALLGQGKRQLRKAMPSQPSLEYWLSCLRRRDVRAVLPRTTCFASSMPSRRLTVSRS